MAPALLDLENSQSAGTWETGEMAWIEIIPDDSWEGDLGEMYPKVVDPTYGRVDHILAVHSLNPRSMAAHQALYESAMAGSATLRKVERELIALVVSLENDCHY
jgi:alkylhydroperoxidase family enzyme